MLKGWLSRRALVQLLGEMRVGGLVGGMFFACMVLRGYPSAYAIRDFLPRSDIRV